MQAAWTAGSIPRLKKLPKLKSLLIGSTSKPKRQSWQELYAVAQAWAAESGQIFSPEVAA